MKRVVEIWERSGTFAVKTTESIKKKYFPLLETEISRAAAAAAEQEATAAAAADAEPGTFFLLFVHELCAMFSFGGMDCCLLAQ